MQITKESFEKLKKQLNDATELKKEIIIEIEEARKQGDLSENADYSAAMEKNRSNDALIADLRKQIEQAEVIDSSDIDTSKVSIGCKVTFKKADGTEKTYTIGDSVSADPDNFIISELSPLGKAMAGHHIGDKVSVETRVPYSVTIVKIER